MNTGVTKNDFIYFQNEILKDLKNLELKFNEKTDEMIKNINTTKTSSDSDITKLYNLIGDISEKIGLSEENSKLTNQLNIFQKKLEDLSINSKIKTNFLEKEINNITIKYDKIFISNLVVPGLIGSSCTYPNLASFIENVNKKINELVIDKKKQGMDLKSYKEKLESLIGQFNMRINGVEEKFKEYCNICFNNYEKNSNDRFNAMEDKINGLRMENVKYSSELIERSKELNMDWDKIQNIQTEIYNKLDSELIKYTKFNNDLLKTFESQKSEFSLLKKRFTELSDFIKDVRFRNNLTNLNNNNNNNFNNINTTNKNDNNNKNNNNANDFSRLTNFQKKVRFNQMSKRINFKLKQKLDDSFKVHKSNKERNVFTDVKEKKDNSLHYSPAKTEYHFNNNDNDDEDEDSILSDSQKDADNKLDIKDLKKELIKESNKELNEDKNNDYVVNKPMDLGKVGSTLKNYFNANKGYRGSIRNSNKALTIHTDIKHTTDKNLIIEKEMNNSPKKKNKSLINKESENELSGEEEKIKSIINKKNDIKSAKMLLKTKNDKSNNNSDLDGVKLNLKNVSRINESPNEKKSKKNIISKSIKIPSVKKSSKGKNKNTGFVNIPKIIEKKNNKNLLTINTKKIDEINKENNNRNIKSLTKNNSQIKIDTINSDKSDFSNNFKENEDKKKIIAQDKFSFLTNINETSKNDNLIIDMNTIDSNNNPINFNNIKIGEENMNLDFGILNKKIIKTNNRLTELYIDSEQKINKIYQYVKTVFDHLSGIFFFKDLYNQKFSFDFSPKSLMTQNNFSSNFPVKRGNKTKIFLKGKNKFFSPLNLKKHETYKTLVNRIEPYLIKKFKE